MLRALPGCFFVVLLATASVARAGDGDVVESEPDEDPSAGDTDADGATDADGLEALAREHPPLAPGAADAPARPTSAWSDRITVRLGAGLTYELSAWPGAVLFGESGTDAGPGFSILASVRFGLSRILELVAELGARFAFYGDLASGSMVTGPQASSVLTVTPVATLSLRIRPGGHRFYLGAGAGVGWAFLSGDATAAGMPLEKLGADHGLFGDLEGQVGLLLGQNRNWDVGARFRILGYPEVPNVGTGAVAFELVASAPLFSRR